MTMSVFRWRPSATAARMPLTTLPPVCSFRMSGGVGFCNAVRRSLLSDVTTEAPHSVRIHVNTTCYTDEFLAHRIGLVPFRRVGNGDQLKLDASGPCSAFTSMTIGPAFECVHDVEIARLAAGHRLSLTIFIDTQDPATHPRYSPCAAVGMRHLDDGRCEIRFRSNDARAPKELMLTALDRTEERLQRALRALANQPETPPESYC